MVRVMSYTNLERILSLLPDNAEVTVSLGPIRSTLSDMSEGTQAEMVGLMQDYINFAHEITGLEGARRMVHNGKTLLYQEQNVGSESAGMVVRGFEDSQRYRTKDGLPAVKVKYVIDRSDMREIEEVIGRPVDFEQPESVKPEWIAVKALYKMKNSDILQLLKDMDAHKAELSFEEARWDVGSFTRIILTPDNVEVSHSGSYHGEQLPEKVRELLSEIVPYSWLSAKMEVR